MKVGQGFKKNERDEETFKPGNPGVSKSRPLFVMN